MINNRIKSISFIDFLNSEFEGQRLRKTVLTLTKKRTTKKVKKTTVIKSTINKEQSSQKQESAFAKRENVKNRLAKANKLIKSMEVFLDTDEMIDANYQRKQDWDRIYENMKIDIIRDVEKLASRRNVKIKKDNLFAFLNNGLEYQPHGNVLNYSVIIISVFIVAFFITVIFPSFTNKSVAVMDSLICKPIARTIKTENISQENNLLNIDKKAEAISKKQLSEYIKKNANKIKNNQTVLPEDIIGQVAGVEE